MLFRPPRQKKSSARSCSVALILIEIQAPNQPPVKLNIDPSPVHRPIALSTIFFIECLLQAENSALSLENDNQRRQYERCLDEVRNGENHFGLSLFHLKLRRQVIRKKGSRFLAQIPEFGLSKCAT